MSKSIKLKNNVYLDTSSIVHNKELLSELLSKIPQEVVVFEGKLYPSQSIDLDLTPYKRLIISYATYDSGSSIDTGGASNMCMLEISDSPSYGWHKTYITNPYRNSQGGISGAFFVAEFSVNQEKSNFSYWTWVNGTLQNSSATKYYVSKIVGVK